MSACEKCEGAVCDQEQAELERLRRIEGAALAVLACGDGPQEWFDMDGRSDVLDAIGALAKAAA
jgi:hypothetical protein